MSDRDAFLKAIIAEPDEDSHRLVFADWLDEQGEADRAEFIRVQCELARMPDEDPRRTDLEVRERLLLARHAAEWAAPWPAFGNWEQVGSDPPRSVFSRGFLEALEAPGFIVPGNWDEGPLAGVFAAHPVRGIRARGPFPDSGDAFRRCKELRRIESLSLIDHTHGPETDVSQPERVDLIDRLLRSGNFQRLRRFNATFFDVPGKTAVAWLRLPFLANLVAFEDPTDDEEALVVRELARGRFPLLRELDLYADVHPESGEALGALVHSPAWAQLTNLSIPNTEAVPWSAALTNARLRALTVYGHGSENWSALTSALCETGKPPSLEELHFHGACMLGEDLSQVLASESLAGLRRLSFEMAILNDDNLRLSRSPVLRTLTRLVLEYRQASGAGLTALCASPHLGRLKHLRVTGGFFPREALAALARNESARGLRSLSCIAIQEPNQLLALTEGEPFPDLHTLSLIGWHGGLTPASLERVLHSPNLPRLRVVRFRVEIREVPGLAEVFRACDRVAWAGGEMRDGDNQVRVSVKPENVYLPHHLDDLPE